VQVLSGAGCKQRRVQVRALDKLTVRLVRLRSKVCMARTAGVTWHDNRVPNGSLHCCG
jgi:hypothetical protein